MAWGGGFWVGGCLGGELSTVGDANDGHGSQMFSIFCLHNIEGAGLG